MVSALLPTRPWIVDNPLPVGPFDLIYADPPWEYDFSNDKVRAIESHYATMPLAEICKLPVAKIAADDSVLFLWATPPKIREALEVAAAWGFEYRTQLVWIKGRISCGWWVRQAHEILLLCTRGNPGTPPPSRRPDSTIFRVKTREHSAKPPEVRLIISRMVRTGSRRVELFGRGRPPSGWVFWGNQAVALPGKGGRPRTNHFDREEAVRLRAAGLSWTQIAKRLGASRDAVKWAVCNPSKSGFHTPLIGGSTRPESPAETGPEGE